MGKGRVVSGRGGKGGWRDGRGGKREDMESERRREKRGEWWRGGRRLINEAVIRWYQQKKKKNGGTAAEQTSRDLQLWKDKTKNPDRGWSGCRKPQVLTAPVSSKEDTEISRLCRFLARPTQTHCQFFTASVKIWIGTARRIQVVMAVILIKQRINFNESPSWLLLVVLVEVAAECRTLSLLPTVSVWPSEKIHLGKLTMLKTLPKLLLLAEITNNLLAVWLTRSPADLVNPLEGQRLNWHLKCDKNLSYLPH